MKRSIIALLLVLPLVFMLTACTANTNGDNSGGGSPETVPVTSITVSGSNNAYAGETVVLTAKVLPDNATNKDVVWSIESGSSYGSVDDSGNVTALSAGTMVVTATAADGSGISCDYTVTITEQIVSNIPVTGLQLGGDTEVTVGSTLQLTVAVTPADATNPSVVWSIESGSEFASIDANGLLTAIKAGSVTVKVTAVDSSGVSATYAVTVKEAAPTEIKVTGITISGSKSVTVGKTLQLSAALKPDNATNKAVAWSISSGSEFATIDRNGKLSAKAAGSVTVTATAADGSGVSATYVITVKEAAPTEIKVTGIIISGGNSVTAGKTLQLSAAVTPENAANKAVTWSISSGSSYASIDQNGLLTAKKAGSVTIKATAKDGSGKSATYKITVKAASTALWDGSGTKNDPYLIRNLNDLMNLKNVVKKKGYYFKQVADIDCASVVEWVVIGDYDNAFRHHYDGGNYTISNLCLNGDAQGLFSRVEGSHFKNIKIVNAHTKNGAAGYDTGAIVGYGAGCSFENCSATVNFQSTRNATGGLIGYAVLKNEKHAFMKNCSVTGVVTGKGCIGGLIGKIHDYLTDDGYAPDETISVENCSADVEIIAFAGNTESCIGGLIGESFGVKVVNCHTKGSINVIDGDIGGLVGNAGNYTDITRCSAKVDIYASSQNQYGGVSIGGLIGHIYSRSDVYDCYATGNITAPNVGWSPCQDNINYNGGPWRRYYNPCGSLIGTLEVFRAYSEDQKITVYNCYATGKVNVPNICEDERVYCHGALIGFVLDRYTITNVVDQTQKDQSSWGGFSETYIGHFGNNYNLEDLRTYYSPINDYKSTGTSGLKNPKYDKLPQHEYVEIITNTQLKQQSTFTGWNFTTIWKMGANGPELR